MQKEQRQTKWPWLDKTEYPFDPHFLELPMGRMHYVDEGKGDPIVLVHGNPGWSFEYRNQIKALSATHRCIAPDHIGFGLSDKPYEFLKNYETIRLEDVGHYPQEENADVLIKVLKQQTINQG